MTEKNKRKLLDVLKLAQIERWIREEGRKEIALATLKVKEGSIV